MLIITTVARFVVNRTGNGDEEDTQSAGKNGMSSAYNFKSEMNIECSPVDILKALLDVPNRHKWDFGLKNSNLSNQKIEIAYKATNSDYKENMVCKYMVSKGKFYIVEEV